MSLALQNRKGHSLYLPNNDSLYSPIFSQLIPINNAYSTPPFNTTGHRPYYTYFAMCLRIITLVRHPGNYYERTQQINVAIWILLVFMVLLVFMKNRLLILAQFRWIRKLVIRFLGGIKICMILLLFIGFKPRMNHYLDSEGPRNSDGHIRNFRWFRKVIINFLGDIRGGIISLLFVEIFMVNCKPRVDWYSESDGYVRKIDGYNSIIFDDCLFKFADGIYSWQLGLLVLGQVVVFDQLKFGRRMMESERQIILRLNVNWFESGIVIVKYFNKQSTMVNGFVVQLYITMNEYGYEIAVKLLIRTLLYIIFLRGKELWDAVKYARYGRYELGSKPGNNSYVILVIGGQIYTVITVPRGILNRITSLVKFYDIRAYIRNYVVLGIDDIYHITAELKLSSLIRNIYIIVFDFPKACRQLRKFERRILILLQFRWIRKLIINFLGCISNNKIDMVIGQSREENSEFEYFRNVIYPDIFGKCSNKYQCVFGSIVVLEEIGLLLIGTFSLSFQNIHYLLTISSPIMTYFLELVLWIVLLLLLIICYRSIEKGMILGLYLSVFECGIIKYLEKRIIIMVEKAVIYLDIMMNEYAYERVLKLVIFIILPRILLYYTIPRVLLYYIISPRDKEIWYAAIILIICAVHKIYERYGQCKLCGKLGNLDISLVTGGQNCTVVFGYLLKRVDSYEDKSEVVLIIVLLWILVFGIIINLNEIKKKLIQKELIDVDDENLIDDIDEEQDGNNETKAALEEEENLSQAEATSQYFGNKIKKKLIDDVDNKKLIDKLLVEELIYEELIHVIEGGPLQRLIRMINCQPTGPRIIGEFAGGMETMFEEEAAIEEVKELIQEKLIDVRKTLKEENILIEEAISRYYDGNNGKETALGISGDNIAFEGKAAFEEYPHELIRDELFHDEEYPHELIRDELFHDDENSIDKLIYVNGDQDTEDEKKSASKGEAILKEEAVPEEKPALKEYFDELIHVLRDEYFKELIKKKLIDDVDDENLRDDIDEEQDENNKMRSALEEETLGEEETLQAEATSQYFGNEIKKELIDNYALRDEYFKMELIDNYALRDEYFKMELIDDVENIDKEQDGNNEKRSALKGEATSQYFGNEIKKEIIDDVDEEELIDKLIHDDKNKLIDNNLDLFMDINIFTLIVTSVILVGITLSPYLLILVFIKIKSRSTRELIYVEEYFDELIYRKNLFDDMDDELIADVKEEELPRAQNYHDRYAAIKFNYIYVDELIYALGDGYSAFEEEAVFEEYPYELFDNKLIREELSRVGNYYDRYCCCYFRWYYICCYRFWLEFIILFMGYWIMFNLYYDSYFLFKYPCDVLCNTPNTPNGLCYYE